MQGAGFRPLPGHRSPRPEAGEHLADHRRTGEDRRFRAGRGTGPFAADPADHDGRHRGLLAARAGHRRRGDRQGRPVLAGLHHLRDDSGQASVPRQRCGRDHRAAPQHPSHVPFGAQQQLSETAGFPGTASPFQEPIGTAGVRGRGAGGAGGYPRRRLRCDQHRLAGASSGPGSPFRPHLRRTAAGDRRAENLPRGRRFGARKVGDPGRGARDRQDANRPGAFQLRRAPAGAGPLGTMLRGRGRATLLAVGTDHPDLRP